MEINRRKFCRLGFSAGLVGSIFFGGLNLLLDVLLKVPEEGPKPLGIEILVQIVTLGDRFGPIEDQQGDLGGPSDGIAFGETLNQLFVVGQTAQEIT